MPVDENILAFINQTLLAEAPKPALALAETLREIYPGACILLYGSGLTTLRRAPPEDVLYDFYVIVDSYRRAYGSPWLAFANAVLPPNVFYIETPTRHGALKAKYAVLSIDHFEKLVSTKTFHSYFWARFAQPCRIVLGSESMRPKIARAVAAAVETFVSRSAPLSPPGSEMREIWRRGLSRSYQAELRAETPKRAAAILQHYGDWPELVSPPIAPLSGGGRREKSRAEFAWTMRKALGGLLSVSRLLKGVFTFHGGIDYIAWKINRHAPFTLSVRDWERRLPLIGAFTLASRYYRLKRRHKLAPGENR